MSDSKKSLEIGDWVEIHGVSFQVTGLYLKANEVPKLELKHPLEMVELPIDFNTIVSCGEDGVMSHTYSPECPKGCYGQTEECIYKKE